MTLRLESIDTVHPNDHGGDCSAERCSCPQCDKTFAGGSICTDRAGVTWSDEFGAYIVHRMAFCDHCRIVFSWWQASNAQGVPYGDPLLNKPAIIRGARSIARILDKHPELRGVECV